MSTNPDFVKRIEKDLEREGKQEEKFLQSAIKDLSSTEKEQAKAQKAAVKAEKTVEKIDKKETSAAQALNKATHKHDVVLTDLHSAEKDAALKQQHDQRLQQELSSKKARVDVAHQQHQAHVQEREAKLAQLHSDSPTINTA